jgi:hypothetical protein
VVANVVDVDVDVVVVDVVVDMVVVQATVVARSETVVVGRVVGTGTVVVEGIETRSALPHAAATNVRRNMTASTLSPVAGRRPGDPNIRMGSVDHRTSTHAGRLPNPIPTGP